MAQALRKGGEDIGGTCKKLKTTSKSGSWGEFFFLTFSFSLFSLAFRLHADYPDLSRLLPKAYPRAAQGEPKEYPLLVLLGALTPRPVPPLTAIRFVLSLGNALRSVPKDPSFCQDRIIPIPVPAPAPIPLQVPIPSTSTSTSTRARKRARAQRSIGITVCQ